MKDSDNLHAVCLDTYPPCVYMNDTSHAVCALVHKINEVCGDRDIEGIGSHKTIACYTFDAGPNACIFLREEHVPLVSGLIEHFFPPPTGSVVKLSESTGEGGIGNEDTYIRGEKVSPMRIASGKNFFLRKKFQGKIPITPGALKYIIHTKIGDGPSTLSEDDAHLLNKETGNPNFL